MWIQNSSAAASIDLTSHGYAGFGNFIDFIGNAGNDYAVGSAGDNILHGGAGADTLLGEGDDDIVSGDYADIAWGNVQGGSGYDAFHYDSPEGISFDAAARSFEVVNGGFRQRHDLCVLQRLQCRRLFVFRG
jgi:Ca2+-binding RTX toxin-like protein